MLTQSGAPGCVIGWTNFSHWHSVNGFRRNSQHFNAIYFARSGGCRASLVYSRNSILECYCMFCGVKLSMTPHSHQNLSCFKSGVDYS